MGSVIENNKEAKRRLRATFPGVRVRKGTGTGCGWTSIYITIPRPEDCECRPYGVYCRVCKEAWRNTMTKAEDLLGGIPFYSYYDDMGQKHEQFNVHVDIGE